MTLKRTVALLGLVVIMAFSLAGCGPTVRIISPEDGAVIQSKRVEFRAETTAPEGWTYSWDFGDGEGQSNEQNPTYIYKSPGTYTVTLKVTGVKKRIERRVTITVKNAPPIAMISAEPTTGEVPLEVRFDGTGSYDPDGTAGELEFHWDFGIAFNGREFMHAFEALRNRYLSSGDWCQDTRFSWALGEFFAQFISSEGRLQGTTFQSLMDEASKCVCSWPKRFFEALSKFLNRQRLYRQSLQFLFSVQGGQRIWPIEMALTAGTIPPELRAAFSDKGFPLSDQASVKNRFMLGELEWLITDQERVFIIRLEEAEPLSGEVMTLNIYLQTEPEEVDVNPPESTESTDPPESTESTDEASEYDCSELEESVTDLGYVISEYGDAILRLSPELDLTVPETARGYLFNILTNFPDEDIGNMAIELGIDAMTRSEKIRQIVDTIMQYGETALKAALGLEGLAADQAIGPQVKYTYEELGEYTVSLTVTDKEEATAQATVTINAKPRAEWELLRIIHPLVPVDKPLAQAFQDFLRNLSGLTDEELHDQRTLLKSAKRALTRVPTGERTAFAWSTSLCKMLRLAVSKYKNSFDAPVIEVAQRILSRGCPVEPKHVMAVEVEYLQSLDTLILTITAAVVSMGDKEEIPAPDTKAFAQLVTELMAVRGVNEAVDNVIVTILRLAEVETGRQFPGELDDFVTDELRQAIVSAALLQLSKYDLNGLPDMQERYVIGQYVIERIHGKSVSLGQIIDNAPSISEIDVTGPQVILGSLVMGYLAFPSEETMLEVLEGSNPDDIVAIGEKLGIDPQSLTTPELRGKILQTIVANIDEVSPAIAQYTADIDAVLMPTILKEFGE